MTTMTPTSDQALLGDCASAFTHLVDAAMMCRRCPRMEGRTRVLGPGNGPLHARILFVAEAPGRLGADTSDVPLSGDRTGRAYDDLLAAGGFTRSAIFVTNAVLCNPRDDEGRNDVPTRQELTNCRDHLTRLIAILDPAWVVSLGAVALASLGAIAPHGLTLRQDVARPIQWSGRWLVPLYHPGPRALLHRSLAIQRADYRRLAASIATTPPVPSR